MRKEGSEQSLSKDNINIVTGNFIIRMNRFLDTKLAYIFFSQIMEHLTLLTEKRASEISKIVAFDQNRNNWD